jgi:hypothetical protein
VFDYEKLMSSKPNIGYQQMDPLTKNSYNVAIYLFFKFSNLEEKKKPFLKRIYDRIFFVGIAKL